MKRNFHYFVEVCKRIFPIIFLLMWMASCLHPEKSIGVATAPEGYHPEIKKPINWNVLFSPGQDSTYRAKILDNVKKYADEWISAHQPFSGNPLYLHCPCDSLLYNFSVTPLAGSGNIPVPPPPTGKGVGGSGDSVLISVNNSFESEDSLDFNFQYNPNTHIVNLNTTSIDTKNILAVIDTGLDSAFFQNEFLNLLWNDPSGSTLRNFQWFTNGKNQDYYWDDDHAKHGTAVTSLAYQALESFNSQNHAKPRLMVLKVLDNNRAGSSFTVSCALSYAMQNHATIINSSLGYYGTNDNIDSVLRHYIGLTSTISGQPITVVTAAGNLPRPHSPGQLCAQPGSGNELVPSRLFFPACFDTSFSNIITVNTLSDASHSCFYQSYSSLFVSVGVVSNPDPATHQSLCCKFKVPFNQEGYEGSSFATPVIAGKLMGCLISNPGSTRKACLDMITTVPNTVPNSSPTVNGRFTTYSSTP